MVLPGRIELPSVDYETTVFPLYDSSENGIHEGIRIPNYFALDKVPLPIGLHGPEKIIPAKGFEPILHRF